MSARRGTALHEAVGCACTRSCTCACACAYLQEAVGWRVIGERHHVVCGELDAKAAHAAWDRHLLLRARGLKVLPPAPTDQGPGVSSHLQLKMLAASAQPVSLLGRAAREPTRAGSP